MNRSVSFPRVKPAFAVLLWAFWGAAARPAAPSPGAPALGDVTDDGGGLLGLTWSHSFDAPSQFLGYAYDAYSEDWVNRGWNGTPWFPFPPSARSGQLDVFHTGAYHAWIASQYSDGAFYACSNPGTVVLYGGTPHTPANVASHQRSGGVTRLTWKPDMYGSCQYQIIVYKDGAGWVDTDGPSGVSWWHTVDYGGAMYAAGKASFTEGWADFRLPGGTYLFYIRAAGWAPPFVPGEYATAPAQIPRNILCYTQYADTAANGSVNHTFAAIEAVGTNYTRTDFCDYTRLTAKLPGHDILLIPAQENASSSQLETVGSAWASALPGFVAGGGIVIQCDHYGKCQILENAGLMTLGGYSGISRDPLVIADPSDPVAHGVSNYSAASISNSYETADGNVVVQTTSGKPVVINKTIGLGNVVAIGHDYDESNPNQDRVVGNAVFNLPERPDAMFVAEYDDFASRGLWGGPFNPSRKVYTLSNTGSAPLDWAAAKTADWLALSSLGGTLAPGASVEVTVSLTAAADTLAAGAHDDTVAFANQPTGAVRTRAARLQVLSVAHMPFMEDFETGPPLGACWEATGTNEWRTEVTEANGSHGGAYAVTMDDSGELGYGSRNELTLAIDLANLEHVILTFWAKEYDDRYDGPPPWPFTGGADFDGVAVSADGVTWYEILAFDDPGYLTYMQRTVDLDAAVAACGLSYNSTFRIRFNHYDFNPAGYDGSGLTLDDISITGTSDALAVTPCGGFASRGPLGGPFNPPRKVYTLRNTGAAPLDWTADKTADWLTLSCAGGTLAPGTSVDVAVSLTSAADTLTAGVTSDTLIFTNRTSGVQHRRSAQLGVRSKNILCYVQYAGSQAQPGHGVEHIFAAIGSVGTNYTREDLHDYTQLAGALPGHDVLLIPQQGYSSDIDTVMQTVGRAWASVLPEFVAGGGTVVACFYDNAGLILREAGVMDPGKGGNTSVYSATVTDPSDPLAQGVSDYVPGRISAGTTGDGNMVILFRDSTGTCAGVVNKTIGLGHVVAIGHDYTSSSPDQDRLVGNAVFNLPELNDALAVELLEGFATSGPERGPFNPPQNVYTLTNTRAAPLNWTAAKTAGWLSLSSTGGALAPGASAQVIVGLSAAADALNAGVYTDTITFTDTASGVSRTRTASLTARRFEVSDSIPPADDLTMPFGEVALGRSRTEQVTLSNVSARDPVTVTTVELIGYYQEDFNDGLAQGWWEDVDANWEVVDGEYRAQSAVTDSMAATYDLQTWNDVSVQAVCRRSGSSSNAARICLRASPGFDLDLGSGSAYLFQVATNGYYGVWKTVNGVDTALQGWTWIGSSVMSPGVNVLQATVQGNQLSYSINGRLVCTKTDPDLTEGRVGVGGYTKGGDCTHYFDNAAVAPPGMLSQVISAEQALLNAHPAAGGTIDEAPVAAGVPGLPENLKSPPAQATAVGSLPAACFRLENVPPLPIVLGAGQSVAFQVVYEPAAPRFDTARILLESDDPANGSVLVQLTGTGVDPVVIVHTPLSDTAEPGPYLVQADITCPFGLSRAELNWSVDGGASWTTVPLTNSGGSTYAAAIPGQNLGTHVFYYIEVEDSAGNVERLPSAGQAEPYTFLVKGIPNLVVTPPSLTFVQPPDTLGARSLILENTGTWPADWSILEKRPAPARAKAAFVPASSRPAINWSAEQSPGTLLVAFRSGTKAGARASAHAALGTTVLHSYRLIPVDVVQVPDKANAQNAAAAYAARPDVAYTEPNYRVRMNRTPDDTMFGQQWALRNTGQTGGTPDADIDAPEAWDEQTGSPDVVVGVIDTGIDYTHPDLAGNMWTNEPELTGAPGVDDDGNGIIDDIHGARFTSGRGWATSGDPMDDNGHGTHVAGVIGASTDNGAGVAGLNWSARLMALKFLDDDGSGYITDAIAALEYAVEKGVNLTNNSWGGGGYSQALHDAIAAAGAAGQLFVAAAGNDATDTDAAPSYPGAYDLPTIIAVASSDHNDAKLSSSNYGAASVDLAAPGSGILSTWMGGGYNGALSGTSLAAPHVTGVAALLLAQVSGARPQDVKNWILDSVDVLPAWSGLTVTGGRLNAARSLELASIGWLDESPQSGTLDPGTSTTITVTADSTGMADGTAEAAILGIHGDPDGAFSVPADLMVWVDNMSLLPLAGWVAIGQQGGPFSPDGATYTLTNYGAAPLDWTAAVRHSWLGVSPSAGRLNAGASVVVAVSLTSAAGTLALGVYHDTVTFTNLTSGVARTRAARLWVRGPASMPFVEDFEAGNPLATYWETTGTKAWRTQVTTVWGAHGGTHCLTMDNSSAISYYSRNELTLTIDLANWRHVVLTFWARQWPQERRDGPPPSPFTDGADFDGVAVSADGIAWHEVLGLRDLTETYQQRTVDLDAAVAACGLSYNSAFRIRFNHYDDYPIPTDGFAFDDISITGTPVVHEPPTLTGARDDGAGQLRLDWDVATTETATVAQFLGFAYDIYLADWVKRGVNDTLWFPFPSWETSGLLDVFHSGAYHAWISGQWTDGMWLPCSNPKTPIVYSGTPHTPSGLSVEGRGGGVWRLHWDPEIYGTWLDQIAVYQDGVGWIAPTDGPSSAFPQFSPWTFLDFGGLIYDSTKASFHEGWADLTLPAEGSYVFYLNFKAWDAATEGPFATAAAP